MKRFWQDIRYGARVLKKQPGFTAIAVLILGLGIGANTAIFSVINAVVLKPLPYLEPDRLVMLWERRLPDSNSRGFEKEMVSPPTLADWKAKQNSFSDIAFWTGDTEMNLVNASGSEKVRCSYVSASLFSTLGVQPHRGRALSADEDRKQGSLAALISYDLWQRRFGSDERVLGQSITLDTYGRRTYTVAGVMPPGFQFPGKTEIWLPAGWNGLPEDRRQGHWLSVLARLKDGVSQTEAKAEMDLIQSRLEKQYPNFNLGTQVHVVPLLEQTLGRNLKTALWVLWAVIAAVLMIACANVANLTLARATARQREIVIRLAVGAGRWQVVRQLLAENLLLALAGAILGWFLAWVGLKILIATSAGQVPRLQMVQLDWRALLFTLIASILTTVLCGLAPAFQSTRLDLNQALTEGGKSATSGLARNRMRSALVVAEVALSLTLLIGAGLMLNSFIRLVRINHGFQTDNLLVAKLDFSITGFTTWVQPTTTRPQVTLRQLIERLQSQPGVRSVAATSGLSRSTTPPRQRILFEQLPGQSALANFAGVTPDYFRTLGMSLRGGRTFSEQDTLEATSVVIINETLARRSFGAESPVGRRMAMEGRVPGKPAENRDGTQAWSEIVGVVSDTRKLNLSADVVPEVYVPYWQYPMQTPELLVRTDGSTPGVAAAVRDEVQTLNRGLPAPGMQTMNELLSDVVAEPRFYTMLITLFGAIALILASVGIYSVISYTVTQRTQEFGIRVALGARRTDVLRLVLWQGMRLVIIGLILGLVATIALTRVMQSLLYEVSATDPLTFILISVLLVATAVLACWIPARRAAAVDPMLALRHE